MTLAPRRSPIDSVAVRVMCFNEEATIVEVLERLLAAFARTSHRLQVEVIDDGSTDASARLVRERFGADGRVALFQHPVRRGIGAVLRHAFRATDADGMVLLCSDLQFAPEDVTALVDALESADMVIARREHRRDVRLRSLVSRADRAAAEVLVGISYPDIHWVRAVRGEMLRGITLRCQTPSVDVELAGAIRDRGGVITTVPLPHYPRRHGTTKSAILPLMVASLLDLLRLAARRMTR